MSSGKNVMDANFPVFRGNESPSEKIDKIMDYLYIQKEQLGYEIEQLETKLRAMKGGAK